MKIDITVSGDRATAVRLEKLPASLHDKLVGKITSLMQKLRGRVSARVPRRSGRLASEIASFVDQTPDLVRGRVKVSVPGGGKVEFGKAAALEYGAKGLVTVTEHRRMAHEVWGRAVAPFEEIVDRYQRRANIPAARYLRGPMAGMRDEILTEIKRAVDEEISR